jgi:DNA-binding NarL/FixJ family response regulator
VSELHRPRKVRPIRARLCVIDSKEVGLAYAHLDACRVDVMGSLPALTQLDTAAACRYDAVLVGCTDRLLMSPAFRARAHQLSRYVKLIAVVPSATSRAAAEAASIGFAGFVSRDVGPRALERTIAAAILGEKAFPRSVLEGIVQAISRASTGLSASPPRALTPRQEQVVELIARGATDREIASALQISESTAHKHVQNALRRSNAKTRSQLVASARQPAFPASFAD